MIELFEAHGPVCRLTVTSAGGSAMCMDSPWSPGSEVVFLLSGLVPEFQWRWLGKSCPCVFCVCRMWFGE